MLDRVNHYVGRCTLCAVLATANSTLADDDRWYRVELMVFSHAGGQSAEQWQPTPELAYPDAVRFLKSPGQVSADSGSGDPAFAIESTTEGELYPLQDNPAVSPAPALPTPFVMLEDEQQEFRGKAAYMQRSGRYRILFHETWLQPVAERSRSLPILLDQSGDTGQWPELQGSIRLYVSRYLHLETNLWLNTDGEYLPGDWHMPAPPLGPSSAPDEALDSDLDSSTEGSSTEYSGIEAELEQWQDGIAAEEDTILGPIYPFRHAVLLQQKRRMRSSEVHYVDHPMLGLVVKLTPLTELELETLAQE